MKIRFSGFLILLILVAVSLSDCSKQPFTSLKVQVTDSSGNIVSGARVNLLLSPQGAITLISDTKGVVWFNNISSGKKTLIVTSGCLSNQYGDVNEPTGVVDNGGPNQIVNVVAHELNFANITIQKTAGIQIHNVSNDSYTIDLKGANQQDYLARYFLLDGNDSEWLVGIADNYTLHAVKTTHTAIGPSIEIDFVLPCGGSTEIRIP